MSRAEPEPARVSSHDLLSSELARTWDEGDGDAKTQMFFPNSCGDHVQLAQPTVSISISGYDPVAAPRHGGHPIPRARDGERRCGALPVDCDWAARRIDVQQ